MQAVTKRVNTLKARIRRIWYFAYQPELIRADGTKFLPEAECDFVQVISNKVTTETAKMLIESEKVKTPVEYTKGRWVAPIKTGKYMFPFLQRLDTNGVKFELKMIPLGQAKEIWYEPKNETEDAVSFGQHWITTASLSWVSASTLYLLDVEGVQPGKMDWSAIGLQANDYKKLVKRLAEITRLVKAVGRRNLKTMIFNPQDQNGNDLPLEYYDGKNVVRQSALPKVMRDKTHIMGRIFTRIVAKNHVPCDPFEAFIKGDFVVVEDSQWIFGDYDVVVHGENAKAELTLNRTGNWAEKKKMVNGKVVRINQDLAAWWDHDVLHDVTWDQQTTLNYPKIFPVSRMREDLDATMNQIHEDLANGRFPGEGTVSSELDRDNAVNTSAFDDDPINSDVMKYDGFARRLADAGVSPKAFINLIYLRVNGIANSMRSSLVTHGKQSMIGYHDRHKITRRNSFRGTCVTVEFLRDYVGVEFDMNGNDCAYDERWGTVWTGEAFRVRYNLHGTHDADDTHEQFACRFYGDELTVKALKDHGVLMPDAIIPKDRENAILMTFTARIPNGAGEYSINRFDFSTWPDGIPLDESIVPVINLSFKKGWHKPQGMLLPKTLAGLKTSRTYSKKAYTMADLQLDLAAQEENPLFGRLCNMMAFFAHVTGGKLPQSLPAMLGDMVDATQQGADIATFQQIAGLDAVIQGELDLLTKNSWPEVDKYTKARRSGGLKVKGRIVETGLTAIEGPYKSAYNDLITRSKTQYSFAMRNADPTVQMVRRMSFTKNELERAKEFIIRLHNSLHDVETKTDEFIEKLTAGSNVLDPFTSRVVQKFAREARNEVVDAAIDEIIESTSWVRMSLAIWHAILKPNFMGDAKHGITDRQICQMGTEMCVADLIIEALSIDGPTTVVGTNHKMKDGTIFAAKAIPLKIERMGNTCEEVIDAAAERVSDCKFVWIFGNNKPLAVFKNVDGEFVKVNVDLPDFLMWSVIEQ